MREGCAPGRRSPAVAVSREGGGVEEREIGGLEASGAETCSALFFVMTLLLVRARQLPRAPYQLLPHPRLRLEGLECSLRSPPLRHTPAVSSAILRGQLLVVLSAGLAACGPPREEPLSSPPPSPGPSVAPAVPEASPVAAPSRTVAAPLASETAAPVVASPPIPPPPRPTPAPVTCANPVTRCFTPRTDTSGGNAPRTDLPFDGNGCLAAELTGGSCAGFRASAGPRLTGGKCCYTGCAFQPAPCGRPLLADGRPRLASQVRQAWISSGEALPGTGLPPSAGSLPAGRHE